MCVRYTPRKQRLADIAAALEADFTVEDEGLYEPRYNAAPTDTGWIVSHGSDHRVLRPARWNYLIGAKRRLVKIRSESLMFPRFRDVFLTNRCAIVTDGFFEWPRDDLNPVWFHPADDGLLLLGGLLQTSKAVGAHLRFSVLTTRANGLVARFHDRMPVLIPLSRLDEWLTTQPEAALKMAAPTRVSGLLATRVSSYVNDVKHDDPGCVAPPSYDE